jgi:5-formyltetrahydrofolate cyclo-ligase
MPQALKQSIRKRILSEREQLSLDLRARLSADIAGRLLQLPEYREASAVLSYMNFGTEFACDLFAARALADGRRLALPKVNRHTNRLDLYWVEDFENQLGPGLWGIREPVVERCKRLESPNEVEFALLPGVAFTREGARLGYGGGFYDKLLAHLDEGRQRPVLVAAAFSLQLVEQLPQEATDIKVERIVTERETIACSA